jgi:hypothetical protein
VETLFYLYMFERRRDAALYDSEVMRCSVYVVLSSPHPPARNQQVSSRIYIKMTYLRYTASMSHITPAYPKCITNIAHKCYPHAIRNIDQRKPAQSASPILFTKSPRSERPDAMRSCMSHYRICISVQRHMRYAALLCNGNVRRGSVWCMPRGSDVRS